MLQVEIGIDSDVIELEELHDGSEMKLLLDMLYDNNLVGEGEGEGDGEVEVDDRGNEGENEPIVNENNDDNDNDEDMEGNMIFEGPDYSVNFHRSINVQNIRDLEFDGGAARETVYRVHLNANWVNLGQST